MFKRIARTVMWVGKGTIFLVGVAAIVAVGFGAAGVTVAGNGDPLKLGAKNTATKNTVLTGNVAAGAALSVRNPAGGTALDLRTNAGAAPLKLNSSALVANLNADQVDGKSANAFLATDVYKRESAVAAGTQIGDGTFVADQLCDPGDILLSGGPANVSATSTLLESFPSPGTTRGWSARINKNGAADNWSVVVLCINQS